MSLTLKKLTLALSKLSNLETLVLVDADSPTEIPTKYKQLTLRRLKICTNFNLSFPVMNLVYFVINSPVLSFLDINCPNEPVPFSIFEQIFTVVTERHRIMIIDGLITCKCKIATEVKIGGSSFDETLRASFIMKRVRESRQLFIAPKCKSEMVFLTFDETSMFYLKLRNHLKINCTDVKKRLNQLLKGCTVVCKSHRIELDELIPVPL